MSDQNAVHPYMDALAMDPRMAFLQQMGPHGGPPNPPSGGVQVRLSVKDASFQYQLTRDDLEKVFARYGQVQKVDLEEERNAAIITFNTLDEAQAAVSDLNGKPLAGQSLDGKLCVELLHPPPQQMYQTAPEGYGYPPPNMMQGMMGTQSVLESHGGQNDEGVRKYTCRFDIGIENDDQFRVARRIIGTSGKNMKKIVKATDAKLRLRGRGSGFLEGAQQRESQEPLQLCISCKTKAGYESAVAQVEALLMEVYQEYAQYCAQNGMPIMELVPHKREHQLMFPSTTGGGGGGNRANRNRNQPQMPDPMQMQHDPYGGQGGYGVPPMGGQMPYGFPPWNPYMMPPYGWTGMENQKSGGKDAGKGGGGRAKGRGKGEVGGEQPPVNRGNPLPGSPAPDEVENLIDQRNEARRSGDFERADAIREELRSKGIALMDEPGGRGKGSEVTTWRYWRG